MLAFGRYRITVEWQGAVSWFRLRLGDAVLADDIGRAVRDEAGKLAELAAELQRWGLTLDQFDEQSL